VRQSVDVRSTNIAREPHAWNAHLDTAVTA